MKPARFRHSLGVEEQAGALAVRWGVDAEKTARAALVHDCAKELTLSQMRELVLTDGQRPDDMMWDSAALLHAPAGACLARRRYGVEDPEALDAIRWHTTGRARMSTLEKILYLADMIEPGREPFEGVEAIRRAASRDLDAAMLLALQGTVAHIKRRGGAVHSATLDALHWFEEQR